MRAVAVVFLTALVLGTQAGATSAPSRNGLIAFARCCGFPGTGIYVIAPDGSGHSGSTIDARVAYVTSRRLVTSAPAKTNAAA